MTEGYFLTGSTMGHVVRMSATGAFGIFLVGFPLIYGGITRRARLLIR